MLQVQDFKFKRELCTKSLVSPPVNRFNLGFSSRGRKPVQMCDK